MKKATIATDGASKGNPGAAGIGVVIRDETGTVVREIGEKIPDATNNVAEYTALIRGLSEALDMGFAVAEVNSDSELMVRQINGRYQVKNEGILPLYESARNLMRMFKSVSVHHVTRDKNKEADKLASEAASPKPVKEAKPVTKQKDAKKPQQTLLLDEEIKPPKKPCVVSPGMIIQKITVRTASRTQFVDITRDIQDAVRASGLADGLCTVFVPHTTAGITINENADPDVTADLIDALNKLAPQSAHYRHAEGNSDSHLKASLMGSSVNVLVEGGRLVLGAWQSVYFCEFDGPRTRQVYVRVG